MITTEFKQRIIEAINADSLNYASASKQAVSLDINASQLSRIRKGELENVVSDTKWMSIGRRLGVSIHNEKPWKAAETPTFLAVHGQLYDCQQNSISSMICDIPDIGKTFTARYFAKNTRNAVYVDGSQCKSKQKFVRSIAKEFGLAHTGRYIDVYEDLVYYLQSAYKPLVIVDEAGDLDYAAFLELKALWNATEHTCGWYMMGADGLRAKIEAAIDRKKVGYTEIFSRFGSAFLKVSPNVQQDLVEFKKLQFAKIAKANIETEINMGQLFAQTGGSLRKLNALAKNIN
jgi:DNA transposition AAA+ family ATPase